MFETPVLRLPLLAAAQAQKHVTHNEALLVLDALVQLAVNDAGIDEPPPTPIDGDGYIVGSAPLGVWAGHGAEIAFWRDGAWNFIQPRNGWRAWDNAGEQLLIFRNGAWHTPANAGTSNPTEFGINAIADETNRLSVNSGSILFNRESDNVRVVLNKQNETDTASFIFQQGFSGRAEFGLTGSNGFSIKVSDDGSSFIEALNVDPATGVVELPNTPAVLRSDESQILNVGYPSLPVDIGRLSDGDKIIDIAAGQTQTLVNDSNGAIRPPLDTGSVKILLENTATAGTVDLSDFNLVENQAALTQTAGAAFLLLIEKIQNASLCTVKALPL